MIYGNNKMGFENIPSDFFFLVMFSFVKFRFSAKISVYFFLITNLRLEVRCHPIHMAIPIANVMPNSQPRIVLHCRYSY